MPRKASPPPPPIIWWRPWLIGFSSLVLGCALAVPAAAQTVRKPPTRAESQPNKADDAPTRESQSAPLAAKKVEEALRLLLRSDSLQSVNRPFRPTEVEGLVFDQTITKVGHDFYDLFYTKWEVPPGIGDFTVTIEEKPGRGTSTLVSMQVNDTQLLEMPLQPKHELLEEAAAEAVAMAQQFLVETRNTSRQLEKEGKAKPEVF